VKDWRLDVAMQLADQLETWQRDAVRLGLVNAETLLGAARQDVIGYIGERQDSLNRKPEVVVSFAEMRRRLRQKESAARQSAGSTERGRGSGSPLEVLLDA